VSARVSAGAPVGAPPSGGEHPIRLCDHPRAARQIELVRGWGGLGSFVCVGLLSLNAGLPLPTAGFRALLAGVIGYMAGWALSVLVWRHLAVAEADAARESAEARRAALLEEIERRSGAVASGSAEG
jgi:uncharacterized membrane protein YccC